MVKLRLLQPLFDGPADAIDGVDASARRSAGTAASHLRERQREFVRIMCNYAFQVFRKDFRLAYLKGHRRSKDLRWVAKSTHFLIFPGGEGGFGSAKQPDPANLRIEERLESLSSGIADSIEDRLEERVEDFEWSVQHKVGFVGHDAAGAVGGDGHDVV